MEKGRTKILLIEDDRNQASGIKECLKESIRNIQILHCGDYCRALGLIPKLIERQIRVVIVDGNLRGGADNSDGAEIVRRIKEQATGVIVISYPTRGEIPGADLQCTKLEGPDSLIPLVRRALEKK